MASTNVVGLPPAAPATLKITCERFGRDEKVPDDLAPNQKIVHLVRHGEATHNRIATQRYQGQYPCRCPGDCIFKDEGLTDAALTQKGRRQATASGASILQYEATPELIVASPLTRTLETMAIACGSALRGLPIVALEGCRERMGVHVADMRRPVEKVKGSFPGVSFASVADGPDALFSQDVREKQDELVARGRAFFWQLRGRPERVIAVFSHSSFLHNTLSHGIVGIDEEERKRRWENGEHRCYKLTFDVALE